MHKNLRSNVSKCSLDKFNRADHRKINKIVGKYFTLRTN
jgi:hypothetical protein